MVDVSTHITINRPVAMVADYAADPDNTQRWYANITAVDWLTPRPLREGTRLAFRARFLGRILVYTYEVVAYRAGERLVMRTDEGPFPMETTYLWEPAGPAATRMTLRNRGKPAAYWMLASPFIARAMRRENRKDLARLKQLIEEKS